METYISKTKLLETIAAMKAENGKLWPRDYQAAIDNQPAVDISGSEKTCGIGTWVSVDEAMPTAEGQFLAKIRDVDGGTHYLIAMYRPEGCYNGGLNKWSCEPVIGPGAGNKVTDWLDLTEV